MNALVLGGAVGIQERTADVHDGAAVPFHAKARFLGYRGNHGGLEVFLVRVADELFHVFSGQGNAHALLALGDGKLGAVEAVVLLRNRVQVDEQAVAQLADGNGNAAGAEVVAALDKAACLAAAEQALDLALDRRVALLHLGARLLHAFHVLRFGGTGGAADAVTAGAAAQQHDLIARSGLFAAYMAGRGGAHHGAHFHALGHVTRVVQLVHLAGCQTYLVAVAGIAGSGGGYQLALGQLAGKRFGNGNRGVARAGDAHGLVHIATARKGVADSAAHTRCRAAERLDLGGVVVRLVLEQEQPVLLFAVDIDLALHGAGVNLFGFVQTGKAAVCAQVLRADGAHVHQAHGLVLAPKLAAHGQVLIEGELHRFVVDDNVGELGAEGGVTAMVGPVGVHHAHLGDGGVATDFLEVRLEKLDVGLIHGKAALGTELRQTLGVELSEALHHFDRLGLGRLHFQRLTLGKGSLARFDGVDDVALDGSKGGIGDRAFQHVHLCVLHGGALALADELDALGGRIGALVELARQRLDREHAGSRRGGNRAIGRDVHAFNRELARGHVYLGLAENRGDALIEQLFGNALRVVPVHDAQRCLGRKTFRHNRAQLMQKLLGFHVETGLLLNINARNHGSYPSVFGGFYGRSNRRRAPSGRMEQLSP